MALILIICLSPLMLAVSLWLVFANKGAGVFFIQDRPGRYSKVFKLIKFKTMTDRRDSDGKFLPDFQRLTWSGRFMRSTSLDELPQLYNILKGDMSFVGPRPLLVRYLPLYTDKQSRRHEVRPGLTGWAQCLGRNGISWDEKFEYDVWYVDHLSFLIDCKIFFLTLLKVISRENIELDTSVDSAAFTGSSKSSN